MEGIKMTICGLSAPLECMIDLRVCAHSAWHIAIFYTFRISQKVFVIRHFLYDMIGFFYNLIRRRFLREDQNTVCSFPDGIFACRRCQNRAL